MRRIRVRIRKGRIVEPSDLPEEAEGWLTVSGEDAEVELTSADEGDIWAGYDPERALKAFRETAGSLKEIDADARIAAIYRAREEGTRPISRP